MRQTALIAVIVLTMCATAQAQWVWRDKNKQVHASDLPPPRDIPDKDVIQRPSAPAQKAAAPVAPASAASSANTAPNGTPNVLPDGRTRTDPELEARRKKAEQEQATQRKAEDDKRAAERMENCDRARANLRQFESGMRIARVNEKGEREVIDDKVREQEIQRARNIAANDCR
jgi:hypothetical protein